MTIWISLGTAAELIKIYPILHAASSRGIEWRVLSTGQSAINFWKQWDDFGLPRDRAVTLNSSTHDLESSGQALSWFVKALVKSRQSIIHAIGEVKPSDAWMVHGDTLSTLIGSVYARRLGLPLAHVEAGLRSSSLLSPFPEEITRRLVSRWASWHFAPGDTPTRALDAFGKSGRSMVINTGHNTLLDTLRLQLDREPSSGDTKGSVVVNIHRFENINNAQRWQHIVQIISKVAASRRVQFVMHPITQHKFSVDHQSFEKLKSANVEFMDRQIFNRFIRMLHSADFVISDGGSNQEECFYMGKPCLIMRTHTERTEGLGSCCVLSQFDEHTIDAFISHPEKWLHAPVRPAVSPSEIILNTIVRHPQAKATAA